MSWIDDAIKHRNRQQELSHYAGQLYEALWKEIEARADEATKKDIPVLITERGELRLANPNGGSPKMLRVRLSRDKSCIEADGLSFKLDYCDNTPCLKYGDKPVPAEEAARLILEPFLFGAEAHMPPSESWNFVIVGQDSNGVRRYIGHAVNTNEEAEKLRKWAETIGWRRVIICEADSREVKGGQARGASPFPTPA